MDISEDFFIYFKNGTPILWNFKLHEQYEIDSEHLIELMKLSSGEIISQDFKTNFIEAGLICNSDEKKWHWDILSKIFHIGTKNIPISTSTNITPKEWVKEYLEFCEDMGPEPKYEKQSLQCISLPDPDGVGVQKHTLREVLYKRKTCREFHDKPITLSQLSNILYYSFGYIHGNWNEEFENAGLSPTAKRKSSPSGGGLHPVQAYVMVQNVEGLEKDIYFYNPDHHLEKLTSSNIDITNELSEILWGQYYCEGISFGIFLTARLDLSAWKYQHSRAYRNVLLDVGHVSQTFQLCATSEGLNTWLTGVFNDSRIEEIIGVDGINETQLFFLAAGHGNPVAFDAVMTESVNEFD